jgi:hypothetical protein
MTTLYGVLFDLSSMDEKFERLMEESIRLLAVYERCGSIMLA